MVIETLEILKDIAGKSVKLMEEGHLKIHPSIEATITITTTTTTTTTTTKLAKMVRINFFGTLEI